MPQAGNTKIEDLLAEYEAECYDFSDMERVVNSSLRYADSMPDSHVRCLLYTMAKYYMDKNDDKNI